MDRFTTADFGQYIRQTSAQKDIKRCDNLTHYFRTADHREKS